MKNDNNKKQFIFSEEHLLEISNILDVNFHTLRKVKKFKNLEKEMFELSDIIYKKLPKEEQAKFERLSYILGEMENYTNALLYSLGIKYGIELQKL